MREGLRQIAWSLFFCLDSFEIILCMQNSLPIEAIWAIIGAQTCWQWVAYPPL